MNKIYPKNKYIIIILSISLCFFGKTDIFAFAGGDGSQNNPYQITTCQDLQDINQDLDAYYIINNNIDCIDSEEWNPNLSEWSGGIVGVSLIPDSYSIDTGSTAVVNNNGYYGFEPIGTELNPFTGNLDGNNHTISNLWIFRKTTQGVGLFGYINNSNIYNLNLINSDIVGARYTGGIAGYMDNGSLYNINLSQNMVRAYLSEYGGGLVPREFITQLKNTYSKLEIHPFFELRYKNVRSIKIKKFPYSLFFVVHEPEEKIHILSCFHNRRNPGRRPRE